MTGSVYYRSGGQPRATNGQYLPWQPSPRSRQQEPASAREAPPPPNVGIVHRDADLPPITPGIGGITESPYYRGIKGPQTEPAPRRQRAT